MGINSHTHTVGQHVKANLVPTLDKLLAQHDAHLVTRKTAAEYAADKLHVTTVSVRKYLVQAATAGDVIEIRPPSGWLVRLPGGELLPDLYAVGGPDVYTLDEHPPTAAAAGRVSFILTKDGLAALLDSLHQRFGIERPAPGVPTPYVLKSLQRVPPGVYGELFRNITANTENIGEDQVFKIADAALGALYLVPQNPTLAEHPDQDPDLSTDCLWMHFSHEGTWSFCHRSDEEHAEEPGKHEDLMTGQEWTSTSKRAVLHTRG